MANAASIAGSILLPVVLDRLNLVRISPGLVRRMLMRLLQILLHSGNLTVTAADLHDSMHSQRIATEQRQPDSQQNCNEFFGCAKHVDILANFVPYVNLPIVG